jgi:hypothetical protein
MASGGSNGAHSPVTRCRMAGILGTLGVPSGTMEF